MKTIVCVYVCEEGTALLGVISDHDSQGVYCNLV